MSGAKTGLDTRLLETLRKCEREEDALPVSGDLPALRLLIVWHRVTIYTRRPFEYEDELGGYCSRSLSPARRLWLPFEVDSREVAVASDIPTEALARQEVERLQNLLLVYPDNTTHAAALKLAVETYRARNARLLRAPGDLAKRLSLVEQKLGLAGAKNASHS